MPETNLILMSPSPAPNPTKVKQLPPPKSSPVDLRISSTTCRRSASLLLLLLPLSTLPCPSTSAFSIGTSGPKEWLKDQKRKASRFILAPIQASRGSLQNASLLLTSGTGSQSNEEIRKLIGSASTDCVAGERSSIVAFQARTGVEVCTFRLLVKNAASLLDGSDPMKLETEAMLDELIRLFTSLGDLVNNCDLQLASDREKVEAGLRETISALDNFDRGIRQCLDI